MQSADMMGHRFHLNAALGRLSTVLDQVSRSASKLDNQG